VEGDLYMGKMIEVHADRVVSAYLAEPSGVPKGGIIVIHEVWGLDDHIKSVADRYAEEGYIALAPSFFELSDLNSDEIKQLKTDLFDPEKRVAVQPQVRKLMAPMQVPDFAKLTTERVAACFGYLYNFPSSGQKVAVTGFCFGGTYSYNLAVIEPRLKLALPFYGHSDQPVEELKSITCPIRAFYGANDHGLISGLDDLKARMAEAGVDYVAKVYPNCGHAFFNDSNPKVYNQAAAEDAWEIAKTELAKVMA
jgi:carboxymethylenebutenolidase